MKPTSLQTQQRIREAQDRALDEILLAREKEGREIGYETFGGPILNESETLRRYDLMLQSMVGKQ